MKDPNEIITNIFDKENMLERLEQDGALGSSNISSGKPRENKE